MSDIINTISRIDQKLQTVNDDIDRNIANQRKVMQQAAGELMSYKSIQARRLENLRDTDAATYEAALWLLHNRALFLKPVYLPMIEINLRQDRFAAALEATVGPNLLKTFVCQTIEDYEMFTAEVLDTRNLSVEVLLWEDRGKMFVPPIPLVELRWNFSLEGFLVGQVEGPKLLFSLLCSRANIHTVAYAATNAPDVVYMDDEALYEFCRRFNTFTCISKNVLYTVRFASGNYECVATSLDRCILLTGLGDVRRIKARIHSLREKSEMLSGMKQNLLIEVAVLRELREGEE
ncbi:11200_t:CDS:2, partial [Paraglomus occultum]